MSDDVFIEKEVNLDENKPVGNLLYKDIYPLGSIMHSFKLFTARSANKFLDRSGAFWQHENYDHIIRNRDELIKIVEYVLYNPVKAGLTNYTDSYKWNYYDPELIGV